jgi:hypothetical protein
VNWKDSEGLHSWSPQLTNEVIRRKFVSFIHVARYSLTEHQVCLLKAMSWKSGICALVSGVDSVLILKPCQAIENLK